MNGPTLSVLGTATPFPTPGNPCSGYLLLLGNDSLCIDAGTGTFAELQRYVALEELSAIWISHLHAYHFSDMPIAFYAYAFGSITRNRKLPVAGPPGWPQRVSSFVASNEIHTMSDFFDVHEIGINDIDRVGEITLSSQLLQHNIDSYGLRVEAANRSMAYSGDTGPCQELVELADGVDLLLCEVGSDELADRKGTIHCAPEEAGQMATAAHVQRLMLTHISRSLEPQHAIERAAEFFSGPITVAIPGSTFTI